MRPLDHLEVTPPERGEKRIRGKAKRLKHELAQTQTMED